jgi:uncharacterized damage-inducible protein DinB
VADEKQTLCDFLDYLRESVVLKAAGLSESDLRREVVPSGTNLLGLVNHLALVETFWFQFVFDGRDVQFVPEDAPPKDWHILPGRSSVAVLERYAKATAESRSITVEGDLDALSKREFKGRHLSLRWVVVHLVEETARHAGHADIMRELIDGTTGR